MSQTRVQLIGDSFDTGAIFDGTVSAIDVDISSNAVISGIATVGELLTPQIKTDVISNESGTGPIELKEGATLPISKTLSGSGDINITGNVTASEIKVNTISNESGTGPIELKEGAILPAGKTLNGDGDINISGNVTIGGLLTYEDVTNIDSVGLITARSGIDVTGGGLNVDGDVQKKGNTVPSAVIGISAPSNPSTCDFWTDTSGEDPILKSWNGIEWIEVGSSTPSEFAPVISNVTLTENDTAGDRFTSQTFDVDITMLIEGAPHSQKALKGEVTAEFSEHPNTEPISYNAVTTYPNNSRTSTSIGSNANTSQTRVWAPNTMGGYSWYYIEYSSSSYVSIYENSEPGNTTNYATSLYSEYAPSVGRPEIAEYFPPTGNNSNHYIVTTDRNFSLGSHIIMTKGATGSWSINFSGSGRTNVAVDPATGRYASVRIQWQGNPAYLLHFQLGDSPYSTNLKNDSWTTSGSGSRHAIAFGNNVYVVSWKNNQDNKNYSRVFDADGNYINQISHGEYMTLKYLKFVKDYFWLVMSGNLYRSSDGLNWTQLNLDYDLIDIRYDLSKNEYQLHAYSNYNIMVYTSNNSGATWVLEMDKSTGYADDLYPKLMTTGDSKIIYFAENSSSFVEHAYPYNEQTLTLSGTGADYSDFNVGDAIRPLGQYHISYVGNIVSISGNDIEVSSEYVYQVGDVIEAVNPTNSAVSSRYLVIDSTGAVTGTVGSDPGYVSVGPDTNQTLTFPATLNTGNSPDDELPVGTTLKVSAQATNSIGSSEFGPSNIITPA